MTWRARLACAGPWQGRRTVPMTSRLYDALRHMATIREGFVVRNLDGSQKTDIEASRAIERICRKAGLAVATSTRSGIRSDPCRAVRREPLAAPVVDARKADRRDDALRPNRGAPSLRDPGVDPRRSADRNRPDRGVLRMLGAPGSRTEPEGRSGYDYSWLKSARRGTRTPTVLPTSTSSSEKRSNVSFVRAQPCPRSSDFPAHASSCRSFPR